MVKAIFALNQKIGWLFVKGRYSLLDSTFSFFQVPINKKKPSQHSDVQFEIDNNDYYDNNFNSIARQPSIISKTGFDTK